MEGAREGYVLEAWVIVIAGSVVLKVAVRPLTVFAVVLFRFTLKATVSPALATPLPLPLEPSVQLSTKTLSK